MRTIKKDERAFLISILKLFSNAFFTAYKFVVNDLKSNTDTPPPNG